MDRAKSEGGNGGVVKLPIGFRFQPTDEELVVHYLKRKVFSLPYPANVIPEMEPFQTNPWDLPGDLKEKRHFFSKRCWNSMRNSGSMSTDCGFWKGRGKEKHVMASGSNSVIGIKKSYVFSHGRRKLRTQWVMHVFCLVGSLNSPHSTQGLMMQVGDWVVCRLYKRKRRARNHGMIHQLANGKRQPPSLSGVRGEDENERLVSPSSCSSGITEVSSNDLDQEASS